MPDYAQWPTSPAEEGPIRHAETCEKYQLGQTCSCGFDDTPNGQMRLALAWLRPIRDGFYRWIGRRLLTAMWGVLFVIFFWKMPK